MLSYLHSLTLLGAHRVLGHSLKNREPPTAKFSDPNRQTRGADAGDIVDALVQDRLVLEKIKGMEGRMKYQIDKLLRMADEEVKTGTVREDGMYNYSFYIRVSHCHPRSIGFPPQSWELCRGRWVHERGVSRGRRRHRRL